MTGWLALAFVIVLITRLVATQQVAAAAVNGAERGAPGWSKGLVWFAALAALIGLAMRLVSLDSSLWLDEFGTLWTIEAGLSNTVERAFSFQGQSPLYYCIVWLFVRVFGEHEIVIRLPSLLCMSGAAVCIYKAGSAMAGVRCGVFSGVVFWMAFAGMRSSAEARPYGLAMLFTSLAFYGFIKAVTTGARSGRVLFVIGGAGLVWTHYVIALVLLGIGFSYLLLSRMRARYSLGRFSLDVALQVLLSAPLFGQLSALWGRRGQLSWIDEVDFSSVWLIAMPELTLLVGALAAGWSLVRRRQELQTIAMLALCVATPLLAVAALAEFGINMVTERYLQGVLTPLSLLAGYTLAHARLRAAMTGWLAWGGLSALFMFASYNTMGSFTGVNIQNWRGAVTSLVHELQAAPDSLVLFRSGFVEDDLRLQGVEVTPAVWAPLRTPGRAAPQLNAVPLNFRWSSEGRHAYYANIVKPAIAERDVFYYLSCDSPADYKENFQDWLEDEIGAFEATKIDVGKGVVLLRFDRRNIQRSAQVRGIRRD